MTSATRWNLAGYYLMIWTLPSLFFVVLSGGFLYNELTRIVQPVDAVVTESSRPLDKEDKAPVDWTGDAVADGWLLGEWLPGETGTVYLSESGEQVSRPMDLLAAGSIAFMLVVFFAAVVISLSTLMYYDLRRRAVRAANDDWRLATLIMPRAHLNEGIPLWVR